jgi:hypothetical protein
MQKPAINKARKLAQELVAVINAMEYEETKRQYEIHGCLINGNSPKHRGAVRRKSLDLTRALAEMRKP